MAHLASHALIGVDGGGTSCRVCLVWQGTRHVATTGSANVFTDLDAAVRAIAKALEEVAVKAGVAPGQVAKIPAYLGLAGVIGPAISQEVSRKLSLENAVVEDDRMAALVGAMGRRNGAVIGCGTGSFLGRQADGELRLIGGYGFKLGDDASAAWLGRGLLAHVLKCADEVVPHSDLTRNAFEEFGQDPFAIVAFGQNASPSDFGRFAPQISAAAKAGDAVAVDLYQKGAAYLQQGLNALGWQATEALCLLGGAANSYLPFLPETTAAAVRPGEGTGLDGAVELAARLAAKTEQAAP